MKVGWSRACQHPATRCNGVRPVHVVAGLGWEASPRLESALVRNRKLRALMDACRHPRPVAMICSQTSLPGAAGAFALHAAAIFPRDQFGQLPGFGGNPLHSFDFTGRVHTTAAILTAAMTRCFVIAIV